MKNLIKNSLVLVVLFTTLLVKANEISNFRNLNDDKTTLVSFTNVKQGNQLVIKDAFGVTLYKENIEHSGKYTKGFDLTELPDGKYFFELEKDLEINVIPFNVKSNNVKFNKELKETIYKPFVRVEDNKIFVSKLSLESNPLSVKIYYDDSRGFSNELIHRETIENTKNIQKVYRLDKNEKGNYRIVLKSEGRIYTEFLDIDNKAYKPLKQKKNKEKFAADRIYLTKGLEDKILTFKGQYFTNHQSKTKN